jgi:tRNA threonylcarbamoyladenosine biosynthesis protein TsaE
LLGDLGAGKTTLTQGLVHALGFSGDVPSPTFTLSRDYPVKNGLTLRHFDLYRLSGHDIVTEELEEELNDAHSINVVEWAQHGDSHLPADRLRVTLAYGEKESDRQIIVEGLGERAAKIVEALK